MYLNMHRNRNNKILTKFRLVNMMKYYIAGMHCTVHSESDVRTQCNMKYDQQFEYRKKKYHLLNKIIFFFPLISETQ